MNIDSFMFPNSDPYSSMKEYNQLTVPLIETMIVPVTVPNNSPADIVNGIAGIASTCQRYDNHISGWWLNCNQYLNLQENLVAS